MAVKRYNEAAWQDIATMKRYNGAAWQEAGFARKYNGTAWQDVYPNKLTLYNAGVWNTISSLINVSFGVASTLTNNPTNIAIAMVASGATGSIAKPYSNIKVDLTKYNKLQVTHSGASKAMNDSNATLFGVYANIPIANDSDADMAAKVYGYATAVEDAEETYTDRVTEIDISALTGNYYIGMRARCGWGVGSHNNVTITKIELL